METYMQLICNICYIIYANILVALNELFIVKIKRKSLLSVYNYITFYVIIQSIGKESLQLFTLDVAFLEL